MVKRKQKVMVKMSFIVTLIIYTYIMIFLTPLLSGDLFGGDHHPSHSERHQSAKEAGNQTTLSPASYVSLHIYIKAASK